MKESKPKSYRKNRIRITDIRKAVAKECLIYNDFSRERINEITRAYLRQLKKDGLYTDQQSTVVSNAVRVAFFMKNEEYNYGTLN
tara:strand:+ start:1014 stop:1268 length:255 start_codon:yes stop_codon:yes gene_type:complete